MEIVLDTDKEEVDSNDPLVVPPDKSVVDIVEELFEEDGVDVPSIVDVEELVSENGNEELAVDDDAIVVEDTPDVVDEEAIVVEDEKQDSCELFKLS